MTMRNFGILAIVLGIIGFIYSGDQLKGLEPVPEGLTARESIDYPRARWEIGALRRGRAGRLRRAHDHVPEGPLTDSAAPYEWRGEVRRTAVGRELAGNRASPRSHPP